MQSPFRPWADAKALSEASPWPKVGLKPRRQTPSVLNQLLRPHSPDSHLARGPHRQSGANSQGGLLGFAPFLFEAAAPVLDCSCEEHEAEQGEDGEYRN